MPDTAPPQDSVGGDPSGRPVGHDGARVDVVERDAWALGPGPAAFVALLALTGLAASIPLFIVADITGQNWYGVLGIATLVLGVVLLTSIAVISPGQTRVVQFFGRYIGTIRRTGLVLTVPLTFRKNVSVRVRNFETNELKVNDADGNPINIAAIVVWQVADTAKATFAVEDYADFVRVQSESALRHVAMSHPYDHADDGENSLRGATDVVSAEIAAEVAARVVIAGLEVIEARISNLAYAPEIAQAMLQRQQAGAIIAARERIVEGAVSMVEGALGRLEADGLVTLDDDRRAAMVSNLLVVLCGESRATPVINTGSLYA
ncbi:SPFH domain-containing protein [Cellulomonas sp. zg-ZUI222]|uniref:SPFH domain-containing protein n=1 Tax=Cellulomonas wangleii TaxID=2816956 RepID=A0ABX8D427_9CELL|nr:MULTISPECIES: SPFH domain-containing protein [Cellulomonas]MBO0898790.1 SPFH domain-containing protein [Cellulomonas sp. zg-ZUI22]MBO0919652.1 SPFH domain-containing protein [Cellulomonas wangleii]MBO0923922.1 SPFH domain-containing protein [Cellulomonas wangleii]MBO0924204.1 SPFH domain-containing protein [Cellulomonas wangleii]QVI62220.1 SPFH domain-containing protein [Cellulomonas wangleii]